MLMADEARRVRRPAAVVFSCEQCKEMFGVASWRSWWLSVASWPECAVPGLRLPVPIQLLRIQHQTHIMTYSVNCSRAGDQN